MDAYVIRMLLLSLFLTGCITNESKHEYRQQIIAKQPEKIQAEPGRFPVKTIPYLNTGSQIYWMDNERIIFSGYIPDNENTHASTSNIYVWETTSKRVKPVKKNIAGFGCYDDGIIRYTTRYQKGNTSYLTGFMGPIGKEKVVIKTQTSRNPYKHEVTFQDPDHTKKQETERSKFACNDYVSLRSMYMPKSRLYKALRPEHGWLDLGLSESQIKKLRPGLKGSPTLAEHKKYGFYHDPADAGTAREAMYAQQIRLWKPGAKEPIPLVKPDGSPLTGYDALRVLGTSGVQYNTFNNTYVLFGAIGHFGNYEQTIWRKLLSTKTYSPINYPVYILDPETGSISLHLSWPGNVNKPRLTRAGLTWGHSITKQNGRAIRMFPEVKYASNHAVSPDGCKVASTVSGAKIMVADVCRQENQNGQL